jgi:predicted TPR repeat methyltransferase
LNALHKKIRDFKELDQLLDIGCGTMPYAKLLKPYVTGHIGVDHGKYFSVG